MKTKKEILKELGNFISVVNKWGVPKQYLITFDNGYIFQSYNSIIVIELDNENKYYLSQDWNYSKTTGKYRNLFLNKNKKEIDNDIKEGKAIILPFL